MKKKKWMSHIEFEILDIVKRKGWTTYRDLLKVFEEEYFDPPNPIRVREKLLRLFLKEKLDRVRVKAFTFSRGREYVYFLPDNPPDWLKEKVKKEDEED